MKASRTMRVSALLPTSLVEEVKKESVESKITQSSIIKRALELWFARKLDKDTRALAKINFDDLPSEDTWHDIQARVS